MKKILIILSFFCITSDIFAGQKIGEYYCSYFKKSYEISASSVKKGRFDYYVYCESADNNKIGFSIGSDKIERFCKYLQEIKNKYSEWIKIAKDNKVTSANKYFDNTFNSVDACFTYGSDWHFEFGVRMNPVFLIMEDGAKYIVSFASGELTASDNQFMKVKGFYFVFSNPQEIDDFIKLFNIEDVIKKSNEEAQTNELFK